MSTSLEKSSSLNPQQRLAVSFFTDPLLPTFGNKLGSAHAAGYKSDTVFESEAVRAEIERIETHRAKSGRDVADYMGSYAMDAARELVAQLSEGRELEIRSPEEYIEELTEELRSVDGDEEHVQALAHAVIDKKVELMKALTNHNKVALQAARVRHEALELLIRYHLGHPEQRITHRDERGVDLADLSDEDMKELGQFVDAEIKRRGSPSEEKEPQVVEAEYELED